MKILRRFHAILVWYLCKDSTISKGFIAFRPVFFGKMRQQKRKLITKILCHISRLYDKTTCRLFVYILFSLRNITTDFYYMLNISSAL